MKSLTLLVGFASLALVGCGDSTATVGATRFEQQPVTVSGTTYQVYMLVRSTDLAYSNPLNDPLATRAVYARVGSSATVYCGPSINGCEAAIRGFNNNTVRNEEEM